MNNVNLVVEGRLMMELTESPCCSRLRNDLAIPRIGLGTYKMKTPHVLSAVLDVALECGYRLIDTAAVYKNEACIGETLRQICPKHSLNPTEIFLTSKLAPRDQGYEAALAAFEGSLQALGHLDLYLIHWPGAQGLKREDPRNVALRQESWRALEQLHGQGKVKAIGVSNYTVRHLKEMEKYATVMPHLLQSECHPALPQQELRAYCSAHQIHFQAYSSLGCGQLLQHDSVVKMAKTYKRTPAQLLLKWALQQEISVIPKSCTVERVRENCRLSDFEMSTEDIDRLTLLGSKTPHHYCWDPTDVV